MSDVKVTTRGIGFIGSRSTPTPKLNETMRRECHIHTDNNAVRRHILACNLQPTTRSSAQINDTSRGFEEGVFLVELNKLEGRTGAIALLSSKLMNKSTFRG